MQRSLLEIYQKKVSGGEVSYLERLLLQFIDHTLTVPVEGLQERQGIIHARPAIIHDARVGRCLPVFTKYALYEQWDAEKQFAISVKGGDLCAALSLECPLLVDPEMATSILLTLEDVASVRDSTLRESGCSFVVDGTPRIRAVS